MLKTSKTETNPTAKKEVDYLIIGAGPAGLQLGYFLEKAGRDYLILEKNSGPGAAFKQYPRHRTLISINKVYTGYDDPEINLRWDWNSLLSDSEEMLFKNYSKNYFPDAKHLVHYLRDFAEKFKLKIEYNSQISQISKNEGFSVIDTSGCLYTCKYLLVTTGLPKPYIPDIPGIDLVENYTNVSIDPENFVNQKVLVIGKGNSGFETADNLVGTTSLIHVVSPSSVSMAWSTKYVGHLRAINNNFLDTYQLKSQNALLDAHILRIERQENNQYKVTFHYTHACDEQEDIIYDRVILCAGFCFDNSIFDESCRPELAHNNRFPKMNADWESSNIKDLYFAGVLMHMRDFKKKQSGFIHGFRYNIRALSQLLAKKYHNQELPSLDVRICPHELTEVILNRMNSNSGLWQQSGYLCDFIVPHEPDNVSKYYQELPIDYVHESQFGQSEHYYTVSLEFGLEVLKNSPDPFAVPRVHRDDAAKKADLSTFLHPIIRRYCRGELIAEHHVLEDLAGEWKQDFHIQPLVEFFEHQLRDNEATNKALVTALAG